MTLCEMILNNEINPQRVDSRRRLSMNSLPSNWDHQSFLEGNSGPQAQVSTVKTMPPTDCTRHFKLRFRFQASKTPLNIPAVSMANRTSFCGACELCQVSQGRGSPVQLELKREGPLNIDSPHG